MSVFTDNLLRTSPIGKLLTERAVIESCLRKPEIAYDNAVHGEYVARLKAVDAQIHALHRFGGVLSPNPFWDWYCNGKATQ